MSISQNPQLIKQKPLVVLYGIPGVGKLTVATELSKITKLPLFHNHLSRDLVNLVFKDKKPKDFLSTIRTSFFEAASKDNLGLIFTFVYAKKTDDEFMHKLVSISTANQTPIYFIQLICEESILKSRIESENRSKYDKVRDFSLVQETMNKYDLLSPFSYNNLTIDITNMEAVETANQIREFIQYQI